MICSTEGCGEEMVCLFVKHEADPAFFNGPPVDWGPAFVCSTCSPETYRRFKNA